MLSQMAMQSLRGSYFGKTYRNLSQDGVFYHVEIASICKDGIVCIVEKDNNMFKEKFLFETRRY